MDNDAFIERVFNRFDDVDKRLTKIEIVLAEKRGERRAGLWLFGTGSGAFGAVLALLVQWFRK